MFIIHVKGVLYLMVYSLYSIAYTNIYSTLDILPLRPKYTTMSGNPKKVGVIGSGLIGRSFAMLFAGAGYKVQLYDIEETQVAGALENIKIQLKHLDEIGLLRGELSQSEQFALISGTSNMLECVSGAVYIQECVPEQQVIKEKVFSELDRIVTDEDCILASSTSSMPISYFTSNIARKSQCIVVHPCNPPFYCPVVEICPAPYTKPEVTELTMAMMKETGQSPVLIKKELFGFVLNRMQYAMLNEVWKMVEDGMISVEDVDSVMKDGLGLRYAFMGPMETCHLNADGFANFIEKFGKSADALNTTMGPYNKMGGESAKKVAEVLNKRMPLDKLDERRKWRDNRLIALAKLKKDLDSKE